MRCRNTIGPAGSKDVETKVLLQQFKIAHEPFSASVMACLPPNDYKIEMVPDREDLRHLPVLSIDPPSCKDIDDALHCIVLPNGNYQVGVSIADVTHYVSPGSGGGEFVHIYLVGQQAARYASGSASDRSVQSQSQRRSIRIQRDMGSHS